MSTPKYFTRLLGTKVTVDEWPPPSTGAAKETWEMTEMTKEVFAPVHASSTVKGMPPALAIGTFKCRSSANDKRLAIMRVYKQIPFAGSEYYDPEDRKNQAVAPYEPKELTALKAFKTAGCHAVPELLGYQLAKQNMMANVPEGCLMYLVWQKVPGESLDEEDFWAAPLATRDLIRAQFRSIYQSLIDASLYVPMSCGTTKIIYDWKTNHMNISGFLQVIKLEATEEWTDTLFVIFGLVSASKTEERYFRIRATDTYHDKNGRRW
ncbi:hypothetical protein PENANT_c013G05851 [Penicillium antarcticum]|uniref:Uncharacterized protein n=1 Tax=Penicillium antarcticum TaxID=416450 RepID=A0A1V6Q662_9EURO|nr:uncharacterized protein N7508_004186 [Penicillium antarcticum]KAJ5308807.1 hypothetical protein N7508_004186 [Penicillium antarcticum]OQD84266.1 hypothetical protein PENANT_c013G05851 [Penicillium antarcticum]